MSGYKREIFKNATVAQSAARDVLAFVFAQELLAPSKDIFIVAPWISNIVVLDNRLGQFDSINPEWGKRDLRLVEIIVAIASAGAKVHIHTRPDAHNKQFRRRIEDAMVDAGVSEMLHWADTNPYLHTKGLLTDRVAIRGSMNLTENGVAFNDEAITVSYDLADVAETRVHFDLYEHD